MCAIRVLSCDVSASSFWFEEDDREGRVEKERESESYTIFIDVEKTYDIIPGDVMVLEKKEGSSKTYYDHTLM